MIKFSSRFARKFKFKFDHKNVPTVTLYVLGRYSDQKFSSRFVQKFKFKSNLQNFRTVALYALARYSDQTFSSRFARKFKFKFDLQNFPTVTLYVWLRCSNKNLLSLIFQILLWSCFMFGSGGETNIYLDGSRRSLSLRFIIKIFRLSRFIFG